MIQDRDLWKFTIENTHDFTSGLQFECSSTNSFDDTYIIFDELYENQSKIDHYINLGKILNKNKQMKIKHIIKHADKYKYTFRTYTVCMYNCNSELISDLGSALCTNNHCDFAILWSYDHDKEQYIISLRSADKVNCSQLAKEILNGGGHLNAAGGTSKIHPSILFGENKIIL
jgi:nanoRNase/pAp phosphatase (c-di-AMP/oligoRNAs hydrolase)